MEAVPEGESEVEYEEGQGGEGGDDEDDDDGEYSWTDGGEDDDRTACRDDAWSDQHSDGASETSLGQLTNRFKKSTRETFAAFSAVWRRAGLLLAPYSHKQSRSLFIVPWDNPVRRFVRVRIVKSTWFAALVMVVIVANAVTMAYEAIQVDNSSDVIVRLNYFFTAFFATELVLKVFSKGAVLNEGAYLRNPLNIVDCVVVVTAVLSIVLESNAQASRNDSLRSIRALRSLMLLRLLFRLRTFRALLNMFSTGGGVLIRVLLINWILWSVFAIIGVRLYGGMWWKCNDPETLTKALCVGTFEDKLTGITTPKLWQRLFYWQSVDNYFYAMLHLFEIQSLEQWNQMMYNAQDTVGVGLSALRNHSFFTAWWYHVFLYCGLYFGLAMIIGTLVFFFSQARQADEEGASSEIGLLDKTQREWRDALLLGMQQRLRSKMNPPEQRFRRALFDIVHSTAFEVAISLVIFANIIVFACQRNPRTETEDRILEELNTAFACFFVVEMVVKLAGLGPRVYFRAGWNVFDFIITILGFLSIFLNAYDLLTFNPNFLRTLRMLRMMRMMRLAKRLKSVRIFFITLVQCLPALCTIGLLLSLIIFVYGVVGVWTLRHITIENATQLSEDVNFRDLPRALVTLFRMTTGENWNWIMWDHMRDETSGCRPGVPFEDCGTPLAPLYFVSFMFLTFVIGNNLFVAVVLDSFDVVSGREDYHVKERDIVRYVEAWERLDPAASGFVHVSGGLRTLLRESGRVLGLTAEDEKDARLATLSMLRDLASVPVANGKVHFYDFLRALINNVYRSHGFALPPHTQQQVNTMAQSKWPVLRRHHQRAAEEARLLGLEAERETLLHLQYAVTLVQAAYRGHQHRRRVAAENAAQARRRAAAVAARASPSVAVRLHGPHQSIVEMIGDFASATAGAVVGAARRAAEAAVALTVPLVAPDTSRRRMSHSPEPEAAALPAPEPAEAMDPPPMPGEAEERAPPASARSGRSGRAPNDASFRALVRQEA